MNDETLKENQEAEIPMRPATSDKKEPRQSSARLKGKRPTKRIGRRRGSRG
jgi:hypothetical protein